MRFSLRELLTINFALCAALAWISWNQIDMRMLWPMSWCQLLAVGLLVVAFVQRIELAATSAVAALVSATVNVCHDIWMVFAYSSCSAGNLYEKDWFADHVWQWTASTIILPALVLPICVHWLRQVPRPRSLLLWPLWLVVVVCCLEVTLHVLLANHVVGNI